MQFRIADLMSSALTVRVSIYFSLFYKASCEVIASRITLPVAHRIPLKVGISSGSDSLSMHVFVYSMRRISAPSLARQSVTLTTGVELLTDTQWN